MYRIAKKLCFEAAHLLPDGTNDDRCGSRLHGHSYLVEIVLSSEVLSWPGFVVDFASFEPLKQDLDQLLDHRLLNDVLDVPPTQDAVAEFIRMRGQALLELPDHVFVDDVRVSAPPPAQLGRGLGSWECRWEAAHRLDGLPEQHRCGRLHGHSYAAGVLLPGTPDGQPPAGLDALGRYVADTFDYQSFVDSDGVAGRALDGEPATSENLARHLYDWSLRHVPVLADLRPAVRVSETVTTWAEFRECP